MRQHLNKSVLALILLSFVAGVLFYKFKPIPYPQILSVSRNISETLTRSALQPAKIIASQYSQSLGDPRSEREVDTALLPLTLRTLKATATQPFPQGIGGITALGNQVVVADWLGGIYVFENNELSKRTFPAIPNNIEAFILSLRAPIGNLRVHDVEYIDECESLALSFERFDLRTNHPQIAVALISINPQTITAKGEWEIIFESEPMTASKFAGQAGGGRLLAKKANKVLLSIGDYNQDGVMIESSRVAQDPKSHFGKILEIDWKSKTHKTVSVGHRNPQGLALTATGDVYSTEHGPSGGDELNLILQDHNYGWPSATLGTDYGVYDWPNNPLAGSHSGFTSPTFAWLPSIGVSNLLQIDSFHPSWNGDLLVTSLKASSLFRLRLENGRVVYSEAIWLGTRIRDLVQIKDGAIVCWTDDSQLLFLTVNQKKLETNSRGLGYFGQREIAICMTCHHFDTTGPTHLAPSFGNLIGRKIASDGFARYSNGLKAQEGVWTKERVKEFLSAPEAFAPGTTMPKLPLSPAEIDSIVTLLANSRER